jgi:2'-5' RNA ligase
MRIFIALDIEDNIGEAILRFMEGVRGFAPDAQAVLKLRPNLCFPVSPPGG